MEKEENKPVVPGNRAWILLTLSENDKKELEYKVRYEGHPFDLNGLLGLGKRAVDKKMDELEQEDEQ